MLFNFFQIRYWIFSGYLVPVLISVVSGAVVSYHVEGAIEYAKNLETSHKVTESIGDLAVLIQRMSTNVRGYLIEKNSTSLNSYNQAKFKYEKSFQNLQDLIADEKQQDSLQEIGELVRQINSYNQDLIELVNQDKTTEALQKWRSGEARKLSEQISEKLDAFRSREEEIVATARQAQEDDLNELVRIVWMTTGISLLAVLGIGILIISIIVKKINQEASAIASAASEIATTVEQQERLVIQQAASVNQTTTSIDELGASSRQSAEQAAAASLGASQVLVLASGGNNNLKQQNSLKDKIGRVQAQIMRLSEHLTQIYSITNLVSDVANQTNMLALNASVEAVRAGEHGKGFGVVAVEIRKLADQSRKSAEKINSLIIDIQNATSSTVIVTAEGTQAVENIVEAINDVAVNIQQISLNAQQQATAIQQIVEAMNALNEAAQESTGGIAQTKIGTQQLNQTALHLRDMI